MNIPNLKSIALDRILDIDEAVARSTELRELEREFLELSLQVPEWLTKSSNILRAEIARRTHEADLVEMRRLETELDGYKTVGERKGEAQNRLAALQSRLGMSKAAKRGAR